MWSRHPPTPDLPPGVDRRDRRGRWAERHLASFEVGFDGEDWKVILWYMDALDAWEEEHTDPMALSFCEAGLHPWSV